MEISAPSQQRQQIAEIEKQTKEQSQLTATQVSQNLVNSWNPSMLFFMIYPKMDLLILFIVAVFL